MDSSFTSSTGEKRLGFENLLHMLICLNLLSMIRKVCNVAVLPKWSKTLRMGGWVGVGVGGLFYQEVPKLQGKLV